MIMFCFSLMSQQLLDLCRFVQTEAELWSIRARQKDYINNPKAKFLRILHWIWDNLGYWKYWKMKSARSVTGLVIAELPHVALNFYRYIQVMSCQVMPSLKWFVHFVHALQPNGYRSLHLVAERHGQPFEALSWCSGMLINTHDGSMVLVYMLT